MDHLWQLDWNGVPEEEMLEAYTTVGFLAGHTSRITLLAWVTAVTYREPGLLAKAVTTLDVRSGGRAWLGIGSGFRCRPRASGSSGWRRRSRSACR
jgi:alkanesulfonate monooxygenase SsuD/methylene tetrahydromethanopterin reductase-like flavin-dependent oxidoreductase (luciferase family)